MAESKHFFSEFPSVSKNEWMDVVRKELRGKSLEDFVIQMAGQSIDPFAHPSDVGEVPPPFPGAGHGWQIGESIDVTDILVANAQARLAIDQGVQALFFILHENLGDHRMESLLEGLALNAISVNFFEKNKNPQPKGLLTHFCHIAAKMGFHLAEMSGSVNWQGQELVTADAIELLEIAVEKLPGFQVLPLNVDTGTHASDGLVETLVSGEHWLSTLSSKGFPPDVVNRHIHFTLFAGTQYFIEIARLRALRMLWANVLAAYGYGAGSSSMPVIAVLPEPESQTDDPYQNIIRATTQGMSAVIGGVDRLVLTPGSSQGYPPAFSVRVARNIQHILKCESGLDRVADPAAGSWFIEQLTLKLAEKCWSAFQKEML